MQKHLPTKFKTLEPWTGWSLPTERDRYEKRSNSSIAELQDFCEGIRPMMVDLIEYLNQFPWGSEIDLETTNLYHMGLSFMEATIPVDLGWKQPLSPNTLPVSRIEFSERS